MKTSNMHKLKLCEKNSSFLRSIGIKKSVFLRIGLEKTTLHGSKAYKPPCLPFYTLKLAV